MTGREGNMEFFRAGKGGRGALQVEDFNLVFISFFLTRRVNVTLKPLEDEDEDVEKERQRVERGEGADDILRLKNLTKVSF